MWEHELRNLNERLAAPTIDAARRDAVAREAHARFRCDHHLIVYGSLMPGGSNHAQLAALRGTWTEGWMTGDLVPGGWGTALGYPALRWRADGPRVAAWLLESDELPEHWARLDAFEGNAYERRLAPLWTKAGLAAVGYFYAAAAPRGP